MTECKDSEQGLGKRIDDESAHDAHDAPTLTSTPNSDVPVFTVPNEEGYFPTGFADKTLVSCDSVRLHQTHPRYARREQDNINFPLLAEGELSFSDPSPGTPSEVVLIGRCDDTIFYLTRYDATVRISRNVFTLLLPRDCLRVRLPDDVSEDVSTRTEALLTERTRFSDRFRVGEMSGDVPEGRVAQSVYAFSTWMAEGIVSNSEKMSRGIETFVETKRGEIDQEQRQQDHEKGVGPNTRKAAAVMRKTAEITNSAVGGATEALTKTVGESLGVAYRNVRERRLKAFVATTVAAFLEVHGALSEGYEIMLAATTNQTTGYVEDRYGREAGDLFRDTVGTIFDFDGAVLSVRRVLDVREVITVAADAARATGTDALKGGKSS